VLAALGVPAAPPLLAAGAGAASTLWLPDSNATLRVTFLSARQRGIEVVAC
jgi:hypothetical protein